MFAFPQVAAVERFSGIQIGQTVPHVILHRDSNSLPNEVPEEVEAASSISTQINWSALMSGTFRVPTSLVAESEAPQRNRPGRPSSELNLSCTFSTHSEQQVSYETSGKSRIAHLYKSEHATPSFR